MKTIYAVILCVLLVLVSACAQKVNDPADVQAIKDTSTAWDKALSDGNANALASIFAPDAIALEPNQPALVGKDAIRSSLQKFLDQYTSEGRSVLEDVRVCGDLAVARATYESKSTLKAGGYSVGDKGSWVAVYQRQPDGSWKIFWDIANSNLPVAKVLPAGEEEQALMQIERDWAAAGVKNDWAALASRDKLRNEGAVALQKCVESLVGKPVDERVLLRPLRRMNVPCGARHTRQLEQGAAPSESCATREVTARCRRPSLFKNL